MRLNVHTDYALRLLMYLAINRERRCTISEVAEHYGISENHLVKVAARLSAGGFTKSIRGRGGGLTLAAAADTMSVGDVVRACESDFHLAECFGDDSECIAGPGCRLRRVLERARSAFLEVLDDASLMELTARNSALRKVLLVEAR